MCVCCACLETQGLVQYVRSVRRSEDNARGVINSHFYLEQLYSSKKQNRVKFFCSCFYYNFFLTSFLAFFHVVFFFKHSGSCGTHTTLTRLTLRYGFLFIYLYQYIYIFSSFFSFVRLKKTIYELKARRRDDLNKRVCEEHCAELLCVRSTKMRTQKNPD